MSHDATAFSTLPVTLVKHMEVDAAEVENGVSWNRIYYWSTSLYACISNFVAEDFRFKDHACVNHDIFEIVEISFFKMRPGLAFTYSYLKEDVGQDIGMKPKPPLFVQGRGRLIAFFFKNSFCILYLISVFLKLIPRRR